MRDGHYGSSMIDVSSVSLREMAMLDSAALREAVASCLTDVNDQMAAFQNSI
ncbi:hypothetical protein ACQEVF_06400 [Nonomuraea polychroma]|jgi:hypothetical protein|uniref:FXSXX-COOH protein n=1 Tax=Nonomuraea polychroma TaxID=46176 RepID=A0A438LXB9_9ACTN|nr:hypothetical protein [Nonomuraea polychroma]RVX38043.1 hypothetical protein EDD27_0333 [Nonomuraea polychroma]